MTEIERFLAQFKERECASFLHTDITVWSGEQAMQSKADFVGQLLWVYHPATKTFYASRCKEIVPWIKRFHSGVLKNTPEILLHLLKRSTEFIYVIGPRTLRLQIEHTMDSFARRAATPRRAAGAAQRVISPRLYALYSITHRASGFAWRVTAPADAQVQDVVQAALRSMKGTLQRASSSYRPEHLALLERMINHPHYRITTDSVAVSQLKVFARMDTDTVVRAEQVNHNIKMLEEHTGVPTYVLTLPGTKKAAGKVRRDIFKAVPAFKLN